MNVAVGAAVDVGSNVAAAAAAAASVDANVAPSSPSSGLFAASARAQRYKKLPHQPQPHTVRVVGPSGAQSSFVQVLKRPPPPLVRFGYVSSPAAATTTKRLKKIYKSHAPQRKPQRQ